MDEDGIYDMDSAGELTEQSAMEEQHASLQTYLDSLPYECETVEEMQTHIVSVCNLISCGSGVLINDRIYPVIPGPHRFPDGLDCYQT